MAAVLQPQQVESRMGPRAAKPGAAPFWPSLAGASAAAGLLALAVPPWELSALAWVAPAPYFWAITREAAAGAGGRRFWWIGFLHSSLLLLLIVPWFAAFTPAGYPAAACYWGVLGGSAALLCGTTLRRTPHALWPAVLAAGWTATEWLRAQGPLAFPWGSLAVTQYRNLPLLQTLDLAGAYGLTLLIALPAAALSAARPTGWRAALAWLAGSTALAALAAFRGAGILAQPAPRGEALRAAVVQSSESHRTTGAAVDCVSPLWEYEERTVAAVEAGAELVLWPEGACEGDVVKSPALRLRLAGPLRRTGAQLLTGSLVEDAASGRQMNSAVLLAADATVRGVYSKVMIVPFGEYLPLRPLLGWTVSLGMPPDDLLAGSRWTALQGERAAIGVSICFESAFGGVSRRLARDGATLLAILTSDGWVGREAAGLQHAAFARMRAVEVRRSVARAAATGRSELIDPFGRVLRSLDMLEKGTATAELPLRRDLTPYARLGDWPSGVAWSALGLPWIASLRRLRRRGRDAAP